MQTITQSDAGTPVWLKPAQVSAMTSAEQELQAELGLPLLSSQHSGTSQGFVLAFSDGMLGLAELDRPELGPTVVDFGAEQSQRRARQGIRKQNLLKALGRRQYSSGDGESPRPCSVLDATAGLGQDAYQIFRAGFQLTLLERSPVVHALLRDGWRRYFSAVADSSLAHNLSTQPDALSSGSLLSLHCLDLTEYSAAHDVVYLDPMYAEGKRKSAAKRDMARLHRLLGSPADERGMLDKARQLARRRVVVKRARQAPPLAGFEPQQSLTGSAARFDIYLSDRTG